MRTLLLLLALMAFLAGPVWADCPIGNLDDDCEVDWQDLRIFAKQWLDTWRILLPLLALMAFLAGPVVADCPVGDLSGDCKVDEDEPAAFCRAVAGPISFQR